MRIDAVAGGTQAPGPDGTLADHGGGLDAAIARFGGDRADWIDLSTGINRRPYPLPRLPAEVWHALPDAGAVDRLCAAARHAWNVPPEAAILPAPGTSALIARIPTLRPAGRVAIAGPTYSEHARSFHAAGWALADPGSAPDAQVIVHPNNPDGRLGSEIAATALTVIDESFADTMPDMSRIARAARPGHLVLKGLGKFWGLGGLRLGFAIGDPALTATLARSLGPWPVSGPALHIGAAALADRAWAARTCARLGRDAARLDRLAVGAGWTLAGGTSLFRLYETGDAVSVQARLAGARIWSRVFSYAPGWIRLGLPGTAAEWQRVAASLAAMRS